MTDAGSEQRPGPGDTAFHHLLAAIKAGREAEVKHLLTEEWTKGDHRNTTLFKAAVEGGQLQTVRRLLQRGFVPFPESPVVLAIRDVNALKIVLAEGYSADEMSSATKKRPLHVAATLNPSAIAPLLQAGADVTARDGVHGNTPLHAACTSCSDEAILPLVQAGAWVNPRNGAGETPLHCLLKLAGFHNFHSKTRLSLARCLIYMGMVVEPSPLSPQQHHHLQREGGRRTGHEISQQARRCHHRHKLVHMFRCLKKEAQRSGVWPLQHLCRLRVRQLCDEGGWGSCREEGEGRGGWSVERVVEGLGLSVYLKDYLLFRDHVMDEAVFSPARLGKGTTSVLDSLAN